MVHVYETHYASLLSTTRPWAAVAIYSKEIVLKDGVRYNLVSSQDPDRDFRVSLLWKNRDYGVGNTNVNPDSLREIVVYNTDGVSATKTLAGQNVSMLASSPVYTLKFAGITPVNSCALSLKPTGTNSIPPAPPSTAGTAASKEKTTASAESSIANATPAAISKPQQMSKTASDVVNSMADTSGDMYAKLMNILGIYVQGAK
jgi:hypothetical protein